MLRRVTGWPYCIVTRGDNGLASLIYDQRAKRVAAIVAGPSREIDCLPEKIQILLSYVFHGCLIGLLDD